MPQNFSTAKPQHSATDVIATDGQLDTFHVVQKNGSSDPVVGGTQCPAPPANGESSHKDSAPQNHASDMQESDSGIEGGSVVTPLEPCTAPKNPAPALKCLTVKTEVSISAPDENDSESREPQLHELTEEDRNAAAAVSAPATESSVTSPPLQDIVTADAKMSSMNVNEVFKHPYKLAAVVSQKICKSSKVDISNQGIYSLFCDVLLQELMGQGYVPGELQPQQTINTETVANYAHFQRGSKVSSILEKVSVLDLNRHIADAVSLEDYTTSLKTLGTAHSVSRALQGLLCMRDKSPMLAPMDESRTTLRAMYSYLVFLESHSRLIDDTEKDGSDQLVLNFVDEMLPSVKIHEVLNERDYQNFKQRLHNVAMKDAQELSSVLTTLVPRALTHLGTQCNTLLSSLLAHQYLSTNDAPPVENEEMKARVGQSALLYIESVLLFSPELCREASRLYLNPNNLLEAIREDNAVRILDSESFAEKLISQVIRPLKVERGLLSPHMHRELGNLERAAAATLLFFPGCDIGGTDFVLSTDGAQLLNVGEEKMVVANNKFFDRDSALSDAHRKELLLRDIQNTFQNFRLSVGTLSWSKFLEELDDLCDTIITKEFADAVCPRILQKLSNVEHVHNPDTNIGTVVYESFLPRVGYIREFLRNRELMDAAEHFVNFLHSKDDATSNTLSIVFMKACGYSQEGSAPEQHLAPPEPGTQPGTHEPQTAHEDEKHAFFSLIDTHRETFVQRFAHQDDMIVNKEPFPGRAERVSTAQYKIAELDTKRRHSIVGTLTRRSSRYLFHHWLPYISLSSALVLSGIVIGVSYSILMLSPLFTVAFVLLCWLPAFVVVLSDNNASWSARYLMSITRDSMNEAAKILYPQHRQCVARTVENTAQSVAPPGTPGQDKAGQEGQDQPGDQQQPDSAAAITPTDLVSPANVAVPSTVLNPGISGAAAFNSSQTHTTI
ncbi:MAG: hypothetical protein ACTJLK_00285 [Anaplasma sp.]